MKNIGNVFRCPASTDPPLAWERFLAERALWTITCNQCRKGAEDETEAQQREQDPFSLSLLLRDDFHPAGSQGVLHAKDSFPTSLTAACCHHSEISPQATGEGSVEISFTGIISPLTEMKPPSGLETAAVWQQETRNEADCGCFGKSSVVGFHNYPIWKYRSAMSRETHAAFLVWKRIRDMRHLGMWMEEYCLEVYSRSQHSRLQIHVFISLSC